MNKIFTTILITVTMMIPIVATAGPRNNSGGKRMGYLPSRFGDNWFFQVGGGVNTVFNGGIGPVGPSGELYLGKWFTPSFGLRIGALGGINKPNGTETGWFSGRDAFWYGHADIDVMWSMFNSFRYNEHRFWDVVPYLRAGAIFTKQMTEVPHIEPGAGIGIHNGLRLGRRVDLYLEATLMVAREKAYRERGNIALFPSATAGIVVKMGRVGFRRRMPEKEYIREIIPVVEEVRDTVTVEVEKTVVDSVLIKEMRETPLTLYFEIDVTVLTQRELDHLERYAHYVLTPESKVLLTGSADKETGNSEHNQWLSEQRNAYVKDILLRVYGLKEENILEVANGDRKNEFRTPEQNRCVTISFVE